MSDSTFSVDTEKLKPAIQQLLDLGERLKKAGEDLDMNCQAYGQPWGNDKSGKKFYDQYETPHSQLIDAAYTGAQSLVTAGGQVKNVVTVYEGIDSEAQGMGGDLNSRLDNP